MRVKTFTAGDMPAALAQVRDLLGPDAIIVSSETHASGAVRVVAAWEPDTGGAEAPMPPAEPKPQGRTSTPEVAIATALAAHGVPEPLARQFSEDASSLDEPSAEIALAALCEARLSFGSAPFRPSLRPLVLVGPPGAGKTTTAAKLAALALAKGSVIDIMNADTVKSGAAAQLTGLADRMRLDVTNAENSASLAAGWRARRSAHEAAGREVLAIVDTTGANPFDDDDMARAAALIAGVRGHGVLVLPAGGDPLEQADTTCAFAEIGCTHLIVTRIDATRRLGGMFAAADAETDGRRLKLSGAGISPAIGNGLRPISPISLARLLLAPPLAGKRLRAAPGTREECA